MEAIGLAVGVVGLAGLFGTCMDALDRFASWNNFREDVDHVHNHLEREKYRLKIWGRAVGVDDRVVSANHHEALDDPVMLAMISKQLSEIEKLCTSMDSAFTPIVGSSSEAHPKGRFSTESRLGESRRQKLKWTMRDKAKWTEAAKRLATLVQDLHVLVPPDKSRERSIDGEVRRLELKLDNVDRSIQKSRDKAKEEDCLRLFRRTNSHQDTSYESYRERISRRTDGTCQWFLKHKHFQTWLNQENGLLLVTADPGCGKSVLAKYLTEERLPESATVCYFFFKENDQNTVRQALCAIIHQLFSHHMHLIDYAMPYFSRDGESLIQNVESLWKILHTAILDKATGPVIIVLDALDECIEDELANLMRHLEKHFLDTSAPQGKLKYLLTCRPYEHIISRFHYLGETFQNIYIPGEELSDEISDEIELFIDEKVDETSRKLRLTQSVKSHLLNRLRNIHHRTYLWLYLVLSHLEHPRFKKTSRGIDAAIDTLPETVSEAYEQILQKTENHPDVRRAFHIIIAATRPLKVAEMSIALNVDGETTSFRELDLEDEAEFQRRLQSLCGLFVSVHGGRIYLLHQSAREFLLANLPLGETTLPSTSWRHSIHLVQAHKVLAEICILYLNFFNSMPASAAEDESDNFTDPREFLEYSAKNWASHYREAGGDSSLVPSILQIYSPRSKSFQTWFDIYWPTTDLWNTEMTPLMIASHFGHTTVVKSLLNSGAAVDAEDSRFHKTALMRAAETGQEEVIKLLLDNGADVRREAKAGVTALSFAAWSGHCGATILLLENGADIESRNITGRSALSMAAEAGRHAVVELLISAGAEVESRDSTGKTPLLYAAARSRDYVVNQLLSCGANAKLTDHQLKGALHHAIANPDARLDMIRALVAHGASTNTGDCENMTPLHYTIRSGRSDIAEFLLQSNVDIDIVVNRITGSDNDNDPSSDNNPSASGGLSLTPLHFAAWIGAFRMVYYLLQKGANPNAGSHLGETPLHLVVAQSIGGTTNQADEWLAHDIRIESSLDFSDNDSRQVITDINYIRLRIVDWLLNDPRTDVNKCDFGGECVLHKIRFNQNGIWGSDQLVQRILEQNPATPGRNCDGRTPLHMACMKGDARSIHLLGSAEQLALVDVEGKNALHIASESDSKAGAPCSDRDSHVMSAIDAVIQACEKHNINLSTTRDKRGRNALHLYASSWIVSIDMVKSLVRYGVDATATDIDGRTAAEIYRHEHAQSKSSIFYFDIEVFQLLESYTATSSARDL